MKNELDLQRLARNWGASDIPFTLGHPQDWLGTAQLDQAWARLEQTALLRSVMLVAGPNGVGKSALVGRWMRELDSRLFHPLSLTQATLSGSGLLGSITAKFGKASTFRRERNLQLLEGALAELEHRTLVVVLDEAQNFSHGALEELRLLLGLNLPQRPLFALILIGDEYLLSTLKLRHHRALFSRLGSMLTLQPWTPEQSAQYLAQALQAVGLTPKCIEEPALQQLVQAASGLPRSLCLLAQAAWIAAATAGDQKIRLEHTQQALETVPFAPGLFEPSIA